MFTLPTGEEGVIHLFLWSVGYQGSEEDADELLIADKLLRAVLAEAQVAMCGAAFSCCADHGLIPCLAKGIASGSFCALAWLTHLARERNLMLPAGAG